jgi:protein-S-isoprenylcysteine O-methyltransferase Ste14
MATNPVAAVVFVAALLIWFTPEALGTFRQRAHITRKEASVQDRDSLAILLALNFVGFSLYFLCGSRFHSAAIDFHRTALFVVGIALILAGTSFRWYAIRTLGAFFTRDVAVAADQTVVQTGPYRWIRHPAYTGTFISLLGFALALANWAGALCLLVCVIGGHLYRVSIEEQALSRTLGQPYIDYMRRTRRFIPFVW